MTQPKVDARAELAHSLRMRFFTAPAEPNDRQLDAIIADIRHLRALRPVLLDDWRDAVQRHCPSAGTCKYGAVDNSDLNGWLQEILNAQRK